MLVSINMKNGKSITVNMNVSTQLSAHFKLRELANNKGNTNQPQFIIDYRVDEFLAMLEEFRTWYGKAMNINSCYRQERYNKSVGGDSKSAHLHACAVDWAMPGQSTQDRVKFSNKWKEICEKHGVVGAINYYTNGYHLEAYSDQWYGSDAFKIRDYRGKSGDW